MNSLGIPHDPEQALREFNWNQVNNPGQQRQAAPTPAPTPGPEYVTKEQAEKMARDAARAVLDEQTQQVTKQVETTNQLAVKFRTEEPELMKDHSDLVTRLWNNAVRLNPKVDPQKLYDDVVKEAKFLTKDMGYERKQPEKPAGFLNPYMPNGVNPSHPYYSQEQNSLWEEGYDEAGHKAELQERLERQKKQFGS